MSNSKITSIDKEFSLRYAAIIAGIGLLVMAIIAPIANFAILQELVAPENTAETVNNIKTSEGSFRLAILLFLAVAILDIVVAWGLYIFLKPVNNSLSMLTAWFRIIYAAMLGVITIFLVQVLILLNGVELQSAIESADFDARIMMLLQTFNLGWEFSLIIFGAHLMLLGYLVFRAGYLRNVLGILLMVAAAGYIIDGAGRVLSPVYDITVSVYTFIGEVILIFWLLIKGGREGKVSNFQE